ncbi:FAD-binding protein [Paenibacillus frigoriresistens]|uniref:FAD-binding protein n=1 Tax=Paenibacillus alginolyticus TaxID=59839 RepID=UPI0015663523|nr:FAD-binding protein [Paenibacillus frigoriresistens]NRF94367.1 FAD-binding protein [Paenibacillus frigoriresistens]
MNYNADVLVIGGGQAALRCAIEAREQGASVMMVTKGKAGGGGSSVISDGVHSSIFSKGDSPESFYRDIMRGGKSINNTRLVRVLAEECTARVMELGEKFGIETYYEKEVATPGHSFPRRCYAGDGTGKSITHKMREYAQHIGVQWIENTWVVDLMGDGRIQGAVGWREDEWIQVAAGSTILASGGIGGLYAQSDNPLDVSGECIGMAWRHGATMQDMEFIQFYPYRLVEPKNIDLYTKLFAKGAKMLNTAGQRFMESFSRKEMETRDVLCYEMYKNGPVFLDITEVNPIQLDTISPKLAMLMKKGYDGPLRMEPVEHYSIGGISVDEYGRTGVPGLYVCGECTGGLHGANRLGGGSLTESLVFGKRTGYAAAQEAVPILQAQSLLNEQEQDPLQIGFTGEGKAVIGQYRKEIQQLMWNRVGIHRTMAGLQQAVAELNTMSRNVQQDMRLNGRASQVLADMIRSAWALSYSALTRKESRGAHQMADFAAERPEWLGNIKIQGEKSQFSPVQGSE